MLSKQELNNVLNSFCEGAKELFGTDLIDIILFGSYAREDYCEDSDIDVMILVNIDEKSFHNYRSSVSRIADKADWDFDTLLSPIIVNNADFEKNKNHVPFYSNVYKEGVYINVK